MTSGRLVVTLLLAFPFGALAQQGEIAPELLQEVFPSAVRFGSKEGQPPVYRAFATDPRTGGEALVGFVFRTSDLPPPEAGYNGPIDVLVGMDLAGELTGARVVDYHESLQATRGDFLRDGYFEQQFAGKQLSDPFRIRRDVRIVSGATITVSAAARGIRNAARRVAAAYLTEGTELRPEDLEQLSWPELAARGIGDQLQGVERGALRIELFLVPLRDEAMGRLLMGDAHDRALEALGERATDRPLWMIGVDGELAAFVRANALSIVRGADTLRFTPAEIALTGEPRSGKVDGQFRNVGLIAMDPSVDPRAPFTWSLGIYPGLPPYSVEHPGERRMALASPVPDSAVDERADSAVGGGTLETDAADRADLEAGDSVQEAAPLIDLGMVDFSDEDEETILGRTLASTDWRRFGILALVLVVATTAFFSKNVVLRWVALGATLLVLGVGSAPRLAAFGGGGFLSVSHIISGIKVGPGIYLEDLPLFLLVAFTVVTTLLWGRVFCGYLCPFGALQDVMARVIPRRLQREFPRRMHESGLYMKYGVLAVVLTPAVAGNSENVFQYFEPFGTVFFLSPSGVLWTIAIAMLVASAIIPRFYCRYVCPLGASLALASVLSPFRIERVPQCSVCTVCENACPTGAIQREQIDFKECVRCNDCEIKLIERAGACQHDLEKVSHLIQIRSGTRHTGRNPGVAIVD